ncbi:zinc-ribbon domain containing protein [Pseudoalteromonas shioyasakiensis]|uniref:zinc-ribbon domain containing protein n=1 Tax=Pseudoalteromonas shioyasakiensis TaxID=1190813 RepID=UPI0021185B5A|nr:zinc-ribbon domain containing protein [Pseudoalteromonas shioyasakiensis]MCQ8876884.1 zinc-ribbon domain containing protein [Pseudoalteromonas shioyasakiensis]
MNKVPLNKNAYSQQSKRSVGHEFLAAYYEDIKYVCIKCNSEAVFLAQDQKQAYEVRKEYMWAERKLCNSCWKQMRAIKAKLVSVELEYCANKAERLLNEAFLTQWLDLLVLYPQFGKKANPARVEFVKKHLMSQAR